MRETVVTCDICGLPIEKPYDYNDGQMVEIEIQYRDLKTGNTDGDFHEPCVRPLILSMRRKLAELQRERKHPDPEPVW